MNFHKPPRKENELYVEYRLVQDDLYMHIEIKKNAKTVANVVNKLISQFMLFKTVEYTKIVLFAQYLHMQNDIAVKLYDDNKQIVLETEDFEYQKMLADFFNLNK
jgi:hypothetical protein